MAKFIALMCAVANREKRGLGSSGRWSAEMLCALLWTLFVVACRVPVDDDVLPKCSIVRVSAELDSNISSFSPRVASDGSCISFNMIPAGAPDGTSTVSGSTAIYWTSRGTLDRLPLSAGIINVNVRAPAVAVDDQSLFVRIALMHDTEDGPVLLDDIGRYSLVEGAQTQPMGTTVAFGLPSTVQPLAALTVSDDGRFVVASYADDSLERSGYWCIDRQTGDADRLAGDERSGIIGDALISSSGEVVVMVRMVFDPESRHMHNSVQLWFTRDHHEVDVCREVGDEDLQRRVTAIAVSPNGRFVCYARSPPRDVTPTIIVWDRVAESRTTIWMRPSYKWLGGRGASEVAVANDGTVAFVDRGGPRGDGIIPASNVYLTAPGAVRPFLITGGVDGAGANGDCHSVSIAADGRIVTFDSDASNLVAGDNNQCSDVFMWRRAK